MTKNQQHDVDVICVDDLEEEFKVGFTKPWAIQFADGSCLQYDTEDDACEAQRKYRSSVGLDPMTGEKIT